MATITITKLSDSVGAEITGVDVDQLLTDDALAGTIMDALEENGVLVFRGLHLDPESQVEWCRKLGEIDMTPGHHPVPGIYRVTLDVSKNPLADYLRGTFDWHIDGCTPSNDVPPLKASLLTAHAVAEKGGETEFASTYAAYDDLDDDEKERFAPLRGRARARGVAAAGHARPDARAAGRVAPAADEGAPAGLEAQLRPPFPRDRRDDVARRRHEPRGRPEAARRPARAVDGTRARVPPRVGGRRHGDLGQPRRAAPCRAVRPRRRRARCSARPCWATNRSSNRSSSELGTECGEDRLGPRL